MDFSKLLLIEDNKGTKTRFAGILGVQYAITCAWTIDLAAGEWRKHKSGEVQFDLIILDLNISCNTILLTREEKAKTDNSTLTGWVWAHKKLLSEESFAESGPHILILSSYVPDLMKYLNSANNVAEKEVFDRYVGLNKLKCFEKRDVGGKCEHLVESINKW